MLQAFTTSSAESVECDDPALRFATITAMVLRHAAVVPQRMRALLRLDGVRGAMSDGGVLDHLRADLAAGVVAGRFDAEPDDATVDVLVGAQLLAARRIVDGEVGGDYACRVVVRLLRMLGLDAHSSSVIADEAVATAAELIAVSSQS